MEIQWVLTCKEQNHTHQKEKKKAKKKLKVWRFI